MSKKKDVSEEITMVQPNFGMPLPDFMANETELGIDGLKQYVVPPYIKIIQKQASSELLATFAAGDVILSPTNAVITEMPRDDKGRIIDGAESSFKFVPVLFYPEWATWNPIALKGTEPAIRYRTLDPSDPIVAKSRSATLRTEPHPEKPDLKIRHVEHLNFIVVLYQHGIGIDPAVMSFSRGEWKSGSRFAGLVKMRKAPLYGCVFEANVHLRTGPAGDWFGFDITNPSDGNPWVTAEEYAAFKRLHEDFEDLRKDAKIQAAYDPEASTDEAAVPASIEF